MRLAAALLLVAAPAAAQGPIDFAKIQSTRDSFAVLVQGTPRGFEVMAVERGADGIVVTDETNLMPMMRQVTQVRLGPDGTMRSVKQEGVARGAAMRIDVRYLDGRATGSATAPSPTGQMQNKVVSAAVPAGVVDDNVVVPLLAGVAWGPSASVQIPVFASGQNALHTVTAKVTGSETLTVPLGTFEAYRVEMTGLPAAVTLWVKAEAPHRVLKIAPVGAPLEFVAVR